MDKLGEVLKASTDYLAARQVAGPVLAGEMLAARLLGCKRLELPLQFDRTLTDKQLAAMRRGVKRVGEGEPVQYVIGEAGFMGHIFKADPRALIPRPETEVLVEQVLACDSLWQEGTPLIVDVGTGSGCILISLALARPDAHYIGLDASGDAIALARENASALGVSDRVTFANEQLSDSMDPESLHAVVANLPYIPSAQVETLSREVRDHEPKSALDGGPDGLAIIHGVIQDAAILLRPQGRIFLEIGEDQSAAVRAMLGEEGFSGISVIQDLNQRDRVVTAEAPGEL